MFKCTGSLLKSLVKNQKVVWKRTSFDSYFWSSFSSAEGDVFRSSWNLYTKCLRENSRFYVSAASSYAKTKYKMQNVYDRLIHGKKEKAAAQVAFMITKEMKQSLTDMGFDMKTITNLKPLYAQYIISNTISFDSWKSNNEAFIKACEEEEQQKREEAARLAVQESQSEITASEQICVSEQSNQEDNSGGLVVVSEEEQPKSTPSLMVVEEKKGDSF
ncbi:hypothetical protein WA171_000899 [Blastocystis sp. BT1]